MLLLGSVVGLALAVGRTLLLVLGDGRDVAQDVAHEGDHVEFALAEGAGLAAVARAGAIAIGDEPHVVADVAVLELAGRCTGGAGVP